MLIDGGDGGSGSGGSGGGGGSGKDVGKLTRKRLNRGLPGRKQGTVRIQVGKGAPDVLVFFTNHHLQWVRKADGDDDSTNYSVC